jgi:hypothetical protein
MQFRTQLNLAINRKTADNTAVPVIIILPNIMRNRTILFTCDITGVQPTLLQLLALLKFIHCSEFACNTVAISSDVRISFDANYKATCKSLQDHTVHKCEMSCYFLIIMLKLHVKGNAFYERASKKVACTRSIIARPSQQDCTLLLHSQLSLSLTCSPSNWIS